MLKLGYFSHTNISPSETFIYDLVNSLNEDKDIELTYVTGQNITLQTDFNVKSVASGYSEKNIKWAFRLYKLGQIKGGYGSKWKMNYQKRIAYKQLQKCNLPQFDVAYIEYATSAVLVMDYLVSKHIPFIVHVHGYDVTTSTNDKSYLQELKLLFEKASFFIVASQYMKRRLVLLGCAENKIKLIRLGVDSHSICPISWDKRKKLNPAIIFLGRLTEKKHPIALLHAFKIVKNTFPNAILSIIGGGEMESDVKNEIERLNLNSSIKLYGILNRADSFPIMNQHWIYAQHSVTSMYGDTEGFAISLAEAALHELPVVSTIHNGITENVIDNVTGYLVPEYDFESMAERIIYLIKNPDIAEQMGKAGREHILKLCEPGKRIKMIKELLHQTVCEHKM